MAIACALLCLVCACGDDKAVTAGPAAGSAAAGSALPTGAHGPRGTSAADGSTMAAFISADPSAPLPALGAHMEAVVEAPAMAAVADGEVSSGPLLADFGQNHFLRLSRLRGLQVLDLSTEDDPRLLGELALDAASIAGVYVAGNDAFLVADGWRSYDANTHAESQSAAVVTVDVSDLAAPRIAQVLRLPGAIRASRLTRRGSQLALDVVCDREVMGAKAHSIVRRFDLGAETASARGDLDLGTDVTAVADSGDALLVASRTGQGRSRVSVVSLAAADPVVAQSVDAAGLVLRAANMSLLAANLRVLSQRREPTRENHLETFSLRSRTPGTAISDCSFGEGRNLRSASFQGGRALFVTEDGSAPAHLFVLSNEGGCEEHPEFGLPATADATYAFLDDGTRLLGATSRHARDRVELTLYDVSAPGQRESVLASATLKGEADWAQGGFVLDGLRIARFTSGARGAPPALDGIVVVPAEGHDLGRHGRNGAAVLTFDATSLRVAGFLHHDALPQDAFLLAGGALVTSSDAELRMARVDAGTPPVPKGQIELAPNYASVLVVGAAVARVHRPVAADAAQGASPPAHVEIAPRAAPLGPPVASLEVSGQAALYAVDSLLVSADLDVAAHAGRVRFETFDLTEPSHPRRVGAVEIELSDPLLRALASPAGDAGVEASAGLSHVLELPHALVVSAGVARQDSPGLRRELCATRPASGCQQVERDGHSVRRCFSGQSVCVRFEEEDSSCLGTILECDASFGACAPARDFVPSEQECQSEYVTRRSESLLLAIVDLTAPAQPTAAVLELPSTEHGLRTFADGAAVYYALREPTRLKDDPRSYAAYSFRRIDLHDPAHPVVGESVNVPGELLAIRGGDLYLRDYAWAADSVDRVETALRHAVLRQAASAPSSVEVAASQPFGMSPARELMLPLDGAVGYLRDGAGFVLGDGPSLAVRGAVAVPDGLSVATPPSAGFVVLRNQTSLWSVGVTAGGQPFLGAHHFVHGMQASAAVLGDEVIIASGPYGLARLALRAPGQAPQ